MAEFQRLNVNRNAFSERPFYNGHGHLYDDSSAPSLHGKNREIGAKEVNIKVSMPFTTFYETDSCVFSL